MNEKLDCVGYWIVYNIRGAFAETVSPSDTFSWTRLSHFPFLEVIWYIVKWTGSVGTAQPAALTQPLSAIVREWNMTPHMH